MKKDEDPTINTYQVEIRGRVMNDSTNEGFERAVQLPYATIARYEVIASSFDEAVDMIREYENSGRRESEIVKCTMRLA